MNNETQFPTAGLLRRLGAMLYDSLVVLALLMVTTALFLLLTRGAAVTLKDSGALEYVYRATLLLVICAFFAIFWMRSGQTLGMVAWRLQLQSRDGAKLRRAQVAQRLAGATVSFACALLGFLWTLVDRDRLAWHDRWSNTRLVVLPKRR